MTGTTIAKDNVIYLFPQFNDAAQSRAKRLEPRALSHDFHRARNHEHNLFTDLEKKRMEQIFRQVRDEWNFPQWSYHVGANYSNILLKERGGDREDALLTLSKSAHPVSGFVYEVNFNRSKFPNLDIERVSMRFPSFDRMHQVIRIALEEGPNPTGLHLQAVS